MTKYILIAIAIISMVSLVSCTNRTAVLSKSKTYELTSDIHSLDIEIKAADFTIEESDKFSVESNLKNLSVSEEDGVLTIVDETKLSANYNNAMLKLYIPKNVTFEEAEIKTGAGRLSAESISANTLDLKTGAGKVEVDYLEVLSDISIKGGAGAIEINDGTLNNLTLDLGVGKLDMTAALLGKSDLKFGVGHSALTLIGNKDDYNFDIVNGIGNINIDNKSASAFVSSGNGENSVKITGGVGATDIKFQ